MCGVIQEPRYKSSTGRGVVYSLLPCTPLRTRALRVCASTELGLPLHLSCSSPRDRQTERGHRCLRGKRPRGEGTGGGSTRVAPSTDSNGPPAVEDEIERFQDLPHRRRRLLHHPAAEPGRQSHPEEERRRRRREGGGGGGGGQARDAEEETGATCRAAVADDESRRRERHAAVARRGGDPTGGNPRLPQDSSLVGGPTLLAERSHSKLALCVCFLTNK